MSSQKTLSIDELLKKIPQANEAQIRNAQLFKPEGSPGRDGYFHAFVDYDLISTHGDYIFGNWSTSFRQACVDRDATKYILRHTIRDYDPVGRCDFHTQDDDGIWDFSHV